MRTKIWLFQFEHCGIGRWFQKSGRWSVVLAESTSLVLPRQRSIRLWKINAFLHLLACQYSTGNEGRHHQQLNISHLSLLRLSFSEAFADCHVSSWQQWTRCKRPCNKQTEKVRYRRILTLPSGGGKPCPRLEEESKCPMLHCVLWYDYEREDYPGQALNSSTIPIYVNTGELVCNHSDAGYLSCCFCVIDDQRTRLELKWSQYCCNCNGPFLSIMAFGDFWWVTNAQENSSAKHQNFLKASSRVHKNKSMQHHTLGSGTAEFQVTRLPEARFR